MSTGEGLAANILTLKVNNGLAKMAIQENTHYPLLPLYTYTHTPGFSGISCIFIPVELKFRSDYIINYISKRN